MITPLSTRQPLIVVNVPFEARYAGTCHVCRRRFLPGAEITTMTGPEVPRALYRHAPACPPSRVAPLPFGPVDTTVGPLEARCAPYAHLPLRVRGYVHGAPLDMLVTGETALLLRFTGHGVQITAEPTPTPVQRRRTA